MHSNIVSSSLLFQTILIKYLLRFSGTLQDDVKLLQANTVHGKALGSKDTANIKSKLFNPESNETNIYSEHIKIKHQVEEVNAKIDMIEVDKNTNIAAIQQNADILTIALTELEEHKSILQNISTTLDVLTSNSYTQLNNDNNPYNGTLSHIEASIDREIKINKEQTTMITLLESNLTYEAEARYFQYDTIQALNATTMLLEANTRDLNVTVHINSNKLADLESDMAHDRLRLDNIATQVQLVATLANYSDHIYNLETSQVALNFNIQVLHNAVQKLELNANFTQQILEDTSSSIQLLELQANSTQQALIDHGTRMHAIELELGYLEDYNKRIQQVETETNFTKDTLEDIKTTIQDIEHVGNLTKNSVHDIIGRLANMTGNQCNGYHVGWF